MTTTTLDLSTTPVTRWAFPPQWPPELSLTPNAKPKVASAGSGNRTSAQAYHEIFDGLRDFKSTATFPPRNYNSWRTAVKRYLRLVTPADSIRVRYSTDKDTRAATIWFVAICPITRNPIIQNDN